MLPSDSIHRENLIDILTEEIIENAEDNHYPFYTASTRVLLSWLGYEIDQVHFIDSRDNGIDAWYIADNNKASDIGIDIFQVKTHQLTSEGRLCLDPFSNEAVNDLMRAKNLLLFNEGIKKVATNALKELLVHWSYAMKSRADQGFSSVIPVTLNLVALGNTLTSQAQGEFDRLQSSCAELVDKDGVLIQFNVVLYTMDSIINTRWRENNREWKDRLGHKKTTLDLSPLRRGSGSGYISDNRNAVFYCPAIDLVKAYDALGYQLFEPNVRANIKKSRVNQAIRDSVKHPRTRKDFRFLNNGVTVTCKSYNPPRGGRKSFSISYPGIINGLQTVVALHTAYSELSDVEKRDFEKNCAVLVRLLNSNAVDDITNVVRATNNQNPMKPRNLVSNSSEQIWFARVFAESLGWFYEAKEGAWDAFEKDYKRWRPPLNKTPDNFRPFKKYRSRILKVDNQELAQSWMSFIGFSRIAVNDKKALFGSNYELAFKRRTKTHGFDYEYNVREAEKEAEKKAPAPHLMLLAHISHLFIRDMTLTPQQNQKRACKRLGIDPSKLSRSELDIKLDDDDKFIFYQALRSMSFLFTEFVGFVLYRAFDENVHHYGQRLFANHSFSTIRETLDFEVVKRKIDSEDFESNDLLIVLWLMFTDKIEDLLASDWGQSYRRATTRSRFVLSKESRNRLYKEVQDMDKFMQKRFLMKTWTIGFQEGQGVFDFVRKCVPSI